MAALLNRDEIEADFARQLAKVQGPQREELRQLLGSPPDINRVPLEFWQRVEEENRKRITAILLLIFLTSSDQHSGGIADDATRLQAEQQGLAWAVKRGADLAKDFTDRSTEWLRTKAAKWQGTSVSSPVAPTEPPPAPQEAEIESDLRDIFGPVRQENMPISETTQAASAGGEWMMHALVGTSELDQWHTEHDAKVCQICKPLDKIRRSVWSLKFPAGPPAHPRCRCYIDYAKDFSRADEN